MQIYLVERTDRIDYDEYDSWVVVANNPKEARALCKWYTTGVTVRVKEINPTKMKRVRAILGSFNAG